MPRKLVKENDIASKTGLSAGFIDQCIDKVIWSWKSYNKLHRDWDKKVSRAEDGVASARDEKEKEKKIKSLQKLLKREPSRPSFENKTPCRFDYRTGKVQWEKGKFSPLWIHISTLEKGTTIDIPLNPSQYHLNQLKDAEIDDFEIIKKDKKYYIHISITNVVENKPIFPVRVISFEQIHGRGYANILILSFMFLAPYFLVTISFIFWFSVLDTLFFCASPHSIIVVYYFLPYLFQSFSHNFTVIISSSSSISPRAARR